MKQDYPGNKHKSDDIGPSRGAQLRRPRKDLLWANHTHNLKEKHTILEWQCVHRCCATKQTHLNPTNKDARLQFILWWLLVPISQLCSLFHSPPLDLLLAVEPVNCLDCWLLPRCQRPTVWLREAPHSTRTSQLLGRGCCTGRRPLCTSILAFQVLALHLRGAPLLFAWLSSLPEWIIFRAVGCQWHDRRSDKRWRHVRCRQGALRARYGVRWQC